MENLFFIMDDNLRKMIFRDISEMKLCLKHELPKSTIILAGSIIEAILVDFFLAFPPQTGQKPKEILRADLIALIEIGADKQVNIISDTTKGISTVLRKYRNLIHPGVEYRNQLSIDMNKAHVAVNLVEIIINEIGKVYAEKLGYTAKQAVKKIEVDGYSDDLFNHIIATMSNPEKIKLYREIPLHDCANSTNWNEQGWHLEKFYDFRKLYKVLRKSIPVDIKKNSIIKLYEQVTQNSMSEVLPLLCLFDEDLDLLEPDQRKAVLDYLLVVLEKASEFEIRILTNLWVFTNIGQYYKERQYVSKLRSVLFKISNKVDNDFDLVIYSSGIDQLLSVFSPKIAEQIRNDLASSPNSNVSIMGKQLKELHDIPF